MYYYKNDLLLHTDVGLVYSLKIYQNLTGAEISESVQATVIQSCSLCYATIYNGLRV